MIEIQVLEMEAGAAAGSIAKRTTSGPAAHFALPLLRLVLIVHCAALLAQPSFAGEFLSGTDGVVKFHEWTAWAILALGLLQIAAVVAAMRPQIVSWWMLIGSIFILLAEILQAGTGYARFLRVHVPLGVVIFGAVLLQTISVFRLRRAP